ncbi:unnamed protein product [Dimorphilus gyrociliatus]|uniref:Calcineurin-like phosphoesterase domain-containing protein n=1 Tax=Dimorphilus gyrociliatus TaxID=2664684 RepID=A0A7I8WCW0_9ANNE|nr:unnamed protein product [Dimorphilus gyrociliatus]
MNEQVKTTGAENNPHKVYRNGENYSKKLRIVHISDTHLERDNQNIPDGDIIIHSGDFGQYRSGLSKEEYFSRLNSFFKNLPHKYKIFVGGNHDSPLVDCQRSLITECQYLIDESVTIEGIRIYGSPWNKWRYTSFARAFTIKNIKAKWELIDQDSDIVVTHQPPFNLLDLASYNHYIPNFLVKLLSSSRCEICSQYHPGRNHWGSKSLRRILTEKIKPTLHLFGHVHECFGATTNDKILFCNSAIKQRGHPQVIDFYF